MIDLSDWMGTDVSNTLRLWLNKKMNIVYFFEMCFDIRQPRFTRLDRTLYLNEREKQGEVDRERATSSNNL